MNDVKEQKATRVGLARIALVRNNAMGEKGEEKKCGRENFSNQNSRYVRHFGRGCVQPLRTRHGLPRRTAVNERYGDLSTRNLRLSKLANRSIAVGTGISL